MGVFDVITHSFFMPLRWLQKHYHGKITGKIGQRKSQPPYFQTIGILSCWGKSLYKLSEINKIRRL